MTDWKNEDEIKAELRILTDELRRLRQGLRNMVTPAPKSSPTHEFLRGQSWPTKSSELPRAVAADRPRQKRRTQHPKKKPR